MNVDGTTCKRCSSGYHLKEGKCAKNSIENCDLESVEGETPRCLLCAKKYTTMEDGKCAKIEVENCVAGVSNDPKKCAGCVDKYYLHE